MTLPSMHGALHHRAAQPRKSVYSQVLGTAKNAIVVWIGIVFLGEVVTPLQGGGYALSLAGFFAYNYLKMQGALGAAPALGHASTSAASFVCRSQP